MLGAVELVPLIAMALLGGAIARSHGPPATATLDQFGLVLSAGGLAVVSFIGHPAVVTLHLLGGLLAGFSSLQNVAQSAILPNLVEAKHLRAAIALTYGLSQLTMVIGPGIGGLLIAALGVQAAYMVDALSCRAIVFTVVQIAPQPPERTTGHERSGWRSWKGCATCAARTGR